MNIHHEKYSRLRISAGVAAISFSPLAVKIVAFSPSLSAFYRSFYAALFFLIFTLINHRSEYGKVNYGWIIPSVLAGVFLAIDLVVWHRTIILLGAGPATFLGNSQILFVILFAAIVFRERIRLMYYLTVVMVMTGLFMLTPSGMQGVNRTAGYFMGIIVGFTYAGMLISLRYAKSRSGDEYPELRSLTLVFAVSAALIALYTGVCENSTVMSGSIRDHAVMAAAAFFCQTLGWYMINHSINEVPAHEGSLLLMLQPVLATVWGCVFFAEQLLPVQAAGIVITIAGILVYQLKYNRHGEIPVDFEE